MKKKPLLDIVITVSNTMTGLLGSFLMIFLVSIFLQLPLVNGIYLKLYQSNNSPYYFINYFFMTGIFFLGSYLLLSVKKDKKMFFNRTTFAYSSLVTLLIWILIFLIQDSWILN